VTTRFCGSLPASAAKIVARIASGMFASTCELAFRHRREAIDRRCGPRVFEAAPARLRTLGCSGARTRGRVCEASAASAHVCVRSRSASGCAGRLVAAPSYIGRARQREPHAHRLASSSKRCPYTCTYSDDDEGNWRVRPRDGRNQRDTSCTAVAVEVVDARQLGCLCGCMEVVPAEQLGDARLTPNSVICVVVGANEMRLTPASVCRVTRAYRASAR
jgi:hypothetical protein